MPGDFDGGWSEELSHLRKSTKLIHIGDYAAEVEIDLIYEDVLKTDRVRLALRRGDISAAAKESKVFEMLPLAGE